MALSLTTEQMLQTAPLPEMFSSISFHKVSFTALYFQLTYKK